jgi:hypothetical protein
MKRNLLSVAIWFCLVVIGPETVVAQTRSGSTDVRASVSKTVKVSLSPDTSRAGVELTAFEHGGALRLVLSGSEFKRNLQVPILIRSNTSYKITASVHSKTAALTQLRVVSIEGGGKLVAGDAVAGVVVERRFDSRRGDSLEGKENLSTIDASMPFTVFSGPRISLGGGVGSPHNALKVVLMLSIRATVAQGSWTLDLELKGSGK